MQPARSSDSQTGSRAGPAGQQPYSGVPGLVRPGRRDGRGVRAEVVGGDGGEHQPALGGERSGPQIEQRLLGLVSRSRPDLALVDDQAVRRLVVVRPAFPPDEGQLPAVRHDHLPGGPAR